MIADECPNESRSLQIIRERIPNYTADIWEVSVSIGGD